MKVLDLSGVRCRHKPIALKTGSTSRHQQSNLMKGALRVSRAIGSPPCTNNTVWSWNTTTVDPWCVEQQFYNLEGAIFNGNREWRTLRDVVQTVDVNSRLERSSPSPTDHQFLVDQRFRVGNMVLHPEKAAEELRDCGAIGRVAGWGSSQG